MKRCFSSAKFATNAFVIENKHENFNSKDRTVTTTPVYYLLFEQTKRSLIYLALLIILIMADTNKINVVVKTSSGAKYDISTATDITIEEFKKLLEQQSQIPADQQRLIYSGHVLRNEQKLSDFGK